MDTHTDPFLSDLDAKEQVALARLKEAEHLEQRASVIREEVQAQVAPIQSARKVYQDFLSTRLTPVEQVEPQPQSAPDEVDVEKLQPRMGKKRRDVFDTISVISASPREIADLTGHDLGMIRNTLWQDKKSGLVSQTDDKYAITAKGRRFLQRVDEARS